MPRGYSKVPEEAVCKCCGITFLKTKHQSKYCSPRCRIEVNYKLKQENRDYFSYDEEYSLKRNYGISKEDYLVMLHSQKSVCAICGLPQTQRSRSGTPRRLFVDHDHETGEIRGLLCGKCNSGLGMFKDNIRNLETAIKYLQKGMK